MASVNMKKMHFFHPHRRAAPTVWDALRSPQTDKLWTASSRLDRTSKAPGAPAYENYSLSDVGSSTGVEVEMDVTPEYVGSFRKMSVPWALPFANATDSRLADAAFSPARRPCSKRCVCCERRSALSVAPIACLRLTAAASSI